MATHRRPNFLASNDPHGDFHPPPSPPPPPTGVNVGAPVQPVPPSSSPSRASTAARASTAGFAPASTSSPLQITPSEPARDRSRAYKSRNKRPCDFCRYKKAACHLESEPPCLLCQRHGQQCTFVQSPVKKRRRITDDDAGGGSSSERREEGGGGDGGGGLKGYPRDWTGTFAGDADFGREPERVSQMPSMRMPEDFLPEWPVVTPTSSVQLASMGMQGAGLPDAPPQGFAYQPGAMYHDPALNLYPFQGMQSGPLAPAAGLIDPHLYYAQGAQSQYLGPDIAPNAPLERDEQPLDDSRLSPDASRGEASLERQTSWTSQFVGYSGVMEPHFLAKFASDQYNESVIPPLRLRKMTNIFAPRDALPSFFTIQKNDLATRAQLAGEDAATIALRQELLETVQDHIGRRLVRLFFLSVQPHFPVLSRDRAAYSLDEDDFPQPTSIPTAVLAAIYVQAMPFVARDERLRRVRYAPPPPNQLFALSWHACVYTLHTPSLGLLQALLLMTHQRPAGKHSSDAAFQWTVLGMAVSVAQTLGVNREPGGWTLPAWEIRLRRRLAWALYVQDKWLALSLGRASHMSGSDWDVEPLREDDFHEATEPRRANVSDAPPAETHFLSACHLALIVNDILLHVFSLQAVKRLQFDPAATHAVIEPLQTRLRHWMDSLPTGTLIVASRQTPSASWSAPQRPLADHRLADPALHLAWLATRVELARALMRPFLPTSLIYISPTRAAEAALANECVAFLGACTSRDLDGFWPSYSRIQFATLSSYLLVLYATAAGPAYAETDLERLWTWRNTLQLKLGAAAAAMSQPAGGRSGEGTAPRQGDVEGSGEPSSAGRGVDVLSFALARLDEILVDVGPEKLIALSPAARESWRRRGR